MRNILIFLLLCSSFYSYSNQSSLRYWIRHSVQPSYRFDVTNKGLYNSFGLEYRMVRIRSGLRIEKPRYNVLRSGLFFQFKDGKMTQADLSLGHNLEKAKRLSFPIKESTLCTPYFGGKISYSPDELFKLNLEPQVGLLLQIDTKKTFFFKRVDFFTTTGYKLLPSAKPFTASLGITIHAITAKNLKYIRKKNREKYFKERF